MITSLKLNEIFVFGSNLSGWHGAGAARFAYENFGAEYHVGIGRTGQCYAIPTKDKNIKTLKLADINNYVYHFLEYARLHPYLTFLVTPIGCGLAGYKPKQIAPMFREAPSNVILPEEFKKVL